ALRIDHRDRSSRASRHGLRWSLVSGGAVLALAVGVWIFAFGSAGLPVHAAIAKPVSGSGSLLDASGYVVARRQASVSAKAIYKVVSVLVEEGQHVEEGQILAKLDDTNTNA